ncbi:MAG: hypothetical protein IIX85_03055, partial [Clostridia bacterium]|nr:hypothetical protein [Clostridia bacterium]
MFTDNRQVCDPSLPLPPNAKRLVPLPLQEVEAYPCEVLFKIDELKKIRKENNYNYVISIDGGINDININKVKDVDFV